MAGLIRVRILVRPEQLAERESVKVTQSQLWIAMVVVGSRDNRSFPHSSPVLLVLPSFYDL